MSRETKKFLDANGLTHFVGLLDNYPDNELLATVIDAISDELDNKIDKTDTSSYATHSTAGLMSPTDKQVLDNLNPNVSVTLDNMAAEKIHIINAKQENLVDWQGSIGPIIESQVRTSNLLNVNVELEHSYINSSGVITPSGSAGTDRLGEWIEVTPGQDIYYTGITNPGAGATQKFNRRLHVFDSNHTWIRQVSYVQVTGPNTAWSTHGTMPNNAAYVRMSWNEGDYNMQVTVGAPQGYYPYYITPFDSISSMNFYVSPDDTVANGTSYSINVPVAAGTQYGFDFNPILGKIYVTTGHIASYNGETLPGVWWSDRDIYAEGATPSTGAEVIYRLDEEDIEEYNFTPVTIPLYYHNDYFWIEDGVITSLTYYAETFAVDHLTVYNGVTFGSTYIFESDVQEWNNTANLIDTKADLESPLFTGSPRASTPGSSDNSTRLATTQYVTTKMNNIAPVEQSTKSSKNYTVGQYLMNNGQLYKVISSIATGELFVVGSNIEATDVATELNLLFAQI